MVRERCGGDGDLAGQKVTLDVLARGYGHGKTMAKPNRVALDHLGPIQGGGEFRARQSCTVKRTGGC
jgi:hypothetical protein